MTTSDDNERLDQLGRALVRAAAMTDAEVDRVASPLLYGVVRARIAAARERRLVSATWFDILMIGRRTVPAMLTVALALTGWLWLGSRLTGLRPAARDVYLDRELLTGTTELLTGITMFSDDDMLALLTTGPVAEAPSRENQR